MKIEASILRLLVAAQYNLNQLAEANPLLNLHPHSIMAHHNLDEAIRKLNNLGDPVTTLDETFVKRALEEHPNAGYYIKTLANEVRRLEALVKSLMLDAQVVLPPEDQL